MIQGKFVPKVGRVSSSSMTRTTLRNSHWFSKDYKYGCGMKMDAYTRQILNTAERVINNSPYINNTQKLKIERLFAEIVEEYENEESD